MVQFSNKLTLKTNFIDQPEQRYHPLEMVTAAADFAAFLSLMMMVVTTTTIALLVEAVVVQVVLDVHPDWVVVGVVDWVVVVRDPGVFADKLPSPREVLEL